MVSIIAIIMIIVFILLLSKYKLPVFGALIIVPLIFGVILAVIQGNNVLDIFDWIKSGLFYSLNKETGKVAIGVISPGLLILFAVIYFDLMLGAGLFDPICEFFIKKAKGDPLRVTMATVLVASVITLNGDTTTTIIICLAAFLDLYKQMKMKPIYLAVLLIMPVGIFNQLPWGGPSISCATALNIDISVLFTKLLPGLLAAEAYVIFVGYIIGKKERKRLNFNPTDSNELEKSQINKMLDAIKNNQRELKRPKYFIFNAFLTIVILAMLIMGVAHGAILFMIGSALALAINYKDVKLSDEILENLASDALPPALATFAAGVFSGILTGSGMATSLAQDMSSIIPTSIGHHILPFYAALTSFGTVFLPQDAFYFGIVSVISKVMGQFGISPMQVGVASMVGQAFRIISPVVPPLYMLCDKTKINFVDYQKKYCKYAWPILFIYIFVYVLTGQIPL